jgi:hypothetical protein
LLVTFFDIGSVDLERIDPDVHFPLLSDIAKITKGIQKIITDTKLVTIENGRFIAGLVSPCVREELRS